MRVYLPTNTTPAPVVLFSHGLGGSRAGSAFLGEHWAARGYLAVFLQHPGSDESVWKNEPLAERMQAMNQAASVDNFLLRVQDVRGAVGTEAVHFLDVPHEGRKGAGVGVPVRITTWAEQFDLQTSCDLGPRPSENGPGGLVADDLGRGNRSKSRFTQSGG